jgi:hypothetical protein
MANTAVFAVCFVTPLAVAHLVAWQGWALTWLEAGGCALVARPLLAAATDARGRRAGALCAAGRP